MGEMVLEGDQEPKCLLKVPRYIWYVSVSGEETIRDPPQKTNQ